MRNSDLVRDFDFDENELEYTQTTPSSQPTFSPQQQPSHEIPQQNVSHDDEQHKPAAQSASYDDEPNKVMSIVHEYYEYLLKKLRSHMMLEDIIRDDFALSKFYHELYYKLDEQLRNVEPTQEEYDNLIRQAKFHLKQMYNQELLQFHNEKANTSTENNFKQYAQNRNQLFFSKAEVDFSEPPVSPEIQVEKTVNDIDLHAAVQAKEIVHIPIYKRIYNFLCFFFPVLVWLPEYRTHLYDIKNDVIAGITIGAMLIPQGMGYSLIVGLKPIYGLYAALVPLFVYSVLGTSRQAAIGPTALTALVLGEGLRKLSARPVAGEAAYVAYALIFGIVIGAAQLLAGILRLGYLVNFMSYPVLSGFTSASAIIIVFSQLNNFLGLHMPKDTKLHVSVMNLVKFAPHLHYPSLLLGLASLLFLLIFEKFHFSIKKQYKIKLFGKEINLPRHFSLAKIPGVLALVVTSIVSMAILKAITGALHEGHDGATVNGISIVGNVQAGLPKPGIPHIPGFRQEEIREILLTCIPIGLVGYLETISISKFYALQYGYDIDYNQELIAVGSGNLIGAFVKAFPGTGSMPRTVVNANTGAKTQLAGFISGIMIVLILLVLTPLTFYLPKPALGAIISYSCKKIFDYHHMIFTYKVKKRDFVLLFLAFFCTLFIGIAEGIIIGAAASLALVIFRSTRPRFNRLGRVPGTALYEEMKKTKEAIETPGVLVARFDADIYFANSSYFRARSTKLVRNSPWQVYSFVLDCTGVNQCDSTAIETFKDLKTHLDQHNIELYIAGLKKSIRLVLKRGGLYSVFKKSCFTTLHEAVLRAEYSTRLRLSAMDTLKKEAENNQANTTTTGPELPISEDQINIEISK